MDATGVALVIGATAALVTSAGGVAVQIMTLRSVRKGNAETREIKHLVNSAAEAATAYNLLLSDALRTAGREVPVDPSVKPPLHNEVPS